MDLKPPHLVIVLRNANIRAIVLEGRSLHPRTRKSKKGASSVEARIILFLKAHTIAIMMMMKK
jgi:hypothetical protein